MTLTREELEYHLTPDQLERYDADQAATMVRIAETNRTRKVLIYRITITQAVDMRDQGTHYSLEPWGQDTPYFSGYDDGGALYDLPAGITAAATAMDGIMQLYRGEQHVHIGGKKQPTFIG